jgi:hypothetical protein
MDGEVLANNGRMLDFVADLDFEIRPHPSDASIKSVLTTPQASAPPAAPHTRIPR